METQITFKQYQQLLQKVNKIEFEKDTYVRKYYDLCGEQKEHIKSLNSEIRFLRRKLLEKGQLTGENNENL